MQNRELKFRYILEKKGEIKLFSLSLIDAEIDSTNYQRFRQLIVYGGWSIIDTSQYIGLRDIHNHEVYFGDIVRDIEGWIGVIKWNKKECLIFVDYPFNQDSMMIEDAFGSEPEKNIEIVANIYEDPEFFKEAK